jgi:Fe-Mn family superoxide dismutase
MFTLKALPYQKDALSPYISEQTVDLHYLKHHQGYVNKLNQLVAGTDFEDMELEDIVKKTSGNNSHQAIFNNAGQAFNHDIFWQSLSPNEEDRQIDEDLEEKINKSFGSLAEFKEKFYQAGTARFGSGWVWLVQNNDGLEILSTSNAESPLAMDKNILLGIDVWEHSYYLDYQNKRADYLQACLDNLINWKFIASRLNK